VVGNCQAGWGLMILASLRAELFGQMIIADTVASGGPASMVNTDELFGRSVRAEAG